MNVRARQCRTTHCRSPQPRPHRYPFIGVESWGTQTIEPIAQVIIRPNETAIGKFPNEDAHSLIFDDTNLFKLESKDTLKRRLDEVARFMPMEQMALSRQCGFASTEEGNVFTEAQQWAKMREVVEIAEEVWGK